MARLERLVLSLACEQRLVEGKVAGCAVILYIFDHFVKVYGLLGAKRGARGDVVKRIFGADSLCFERAVKAVAKLAHKGERAAEVDYLSLDLSALRQTRDGLADYRVEYAFGDIAFARALIEQRLDVGLGENAAARSDGVGFFVLLGEVVKLLERNVEQRRHLVDKGARTAGAGAVHAHL